MSSVARFRWNLYEKKTVSIWEVETKFKNLSIETVGWLMSPIASIIYRQEKYIGIRTVHHILRATQNPPFEFRRITLKNNEREREIENTDQWENLLFIIDMCAWRGGSPFSLNSYEKCTQYLTCFADDCVMLTCHGMSARCAHCGLCMKLFNHRNEWKSPNTFISHSSKLLVCTAMNARVQSLDAVFIFVRRSVNMYIQKLNIFRCAYAHSKMA